MPVQVLFWGPQSFLSAIITETVSRDPAGFTVTAPDVQAMSLKDAISAVQPDIIIITTMECREVTAACREFLAACEHGAVLSVMNDGRTGLLARSGAEPRPLDDVSIDSLVAAIRGIVGPNDDAQVPN